MRNSMPPRQVFQKEDIINAAFEIAEKVGINELSTRKIADHLNSSTAPVYSCFGSMEDLKLELLKRAESMMWEYALENYTSSVFLNMGTGLALFARDHKRLFRDIFMENSESKALVEKFLFSIEEEMGRDDLVSRLNRSERKELLRRMWIFAHGLAALICVGLEENSSKNYIIQTMLDMGQDVISVAIQRSGDS